MWCLSLSLLSRASARRARLGRTVDSERYSVCAECCVCRQARVTALCRVRSFCYFNKIVSVRLRVCARGCGASEMGIYRVYRYCVFVTKLEMR